MTVDPPDTTVTHVKDARRGPQAALLSFVESGTPRSVKIMRAEDEILIGRENTSEICIPDSRISRKHALVQIEHSEVKLADLNSLNGTLRNGETVHGTIILNDGDRLILAGTHLIDVRIREEEETVKSVCLILGREKFLIAPGEIYIGSDPETCDIVINDPSVGSRHAHLDFLFDGAYISCIDKQRGLIIDNQNTQCQKLESKSSLKMGAIPISWKYLPDKDSTSDRISDPSSSRTR